MSLFCGAGGLDLGFEKAGFTVGLALDRKLDSVQSYNLNRPGAPVARVQNLAEATLEDIDRAHGSIFRPTGVIGGPPCQSFSQANVHQRVDDVRTALPLKFADIVIRLNERNPLDFFVMENVEGLVRSKHISTLEAVEKKLESAGFVLRRLRLNAKDHGTPQNRPRLFLVGFNRARIPRFSESQLNIPQQEPLTVRDAIAHLPPAIHFDRNLDMTSADVHQNHWCMKPKSSKFRQPGGIRPGVKGRSFKMLSWDEPSIAVAYGHREVNIHPGGQRRLSIYEAMLLQGFPKDYVLLGNLSSQIDQVSEAVPPPLAFAVAAAVSKILADRDVASALTKQRLVGLHAPRAKVSRRLGRSLMLPRASKARRLRLI